MPAATANYQTADRPHDRLPIRYIVIHDIEGSYDAAISSFKDAANGAAANYVMSSTGEVTQMVPDKDIAFQAGNYWFNIHSIGIEHEGFAARGATWYTQAQYRATARLVKYLAAKYGIPLDRQHIIGHDNVPGPAATYVSNMHWDPGPYWDWDYFMQLLGTHSPDNTRRGPAIGSAITIAPDFHTNRQTVQVCGQPAGEGGGGASTPTSCTNQTQSSNFLYVHTGPSETAPLFGDPAIHSDGGSGTNRIDDWGSTVAAGQQFVVADVKGKWTAIWFSGSKVWFYNPGGVNSTPAHGVTTVSAKKGAASAPVYGEAYPQPSDYPSDLHPSDQTTLNMYSVPAGQAYVTDSEPARADDYFSKASGSHPAGTVVTGSESYYTVQYNHRLVLLNSADVTAHRG